MKAQGLSRIAVSLSVLSALAGTAHGRVINGVPVPKGTFGEVVNIKNDGASCSATVVGPQALLTASHCVKTGALVHIHVSRRNQIFTGKAFRHPDYPSKDVDVALVVADQNLGVAPMHVGSTVSNGDTVFLLGYGCTNPGGGGGTTACFAWVSPWSRTSARTTS
jgi:hypothetical protein